ncbi:MAG: recombinase zinc beta ribbon domain-containing protein, partial [Acholeplasmataceae bacterium]|nr:recombinase zinc beta ribbon domain-containing protein [Acholeplasmataceae bacterium]
IIDKETFELAQRIRKDRASVRIGSDKNLSKYTNTYPFTAMIVCSECGRTLKRRYWNYGKPSQRVMQQCGSYIDGKANCTAKASYQEIIEGATIQMLNEVFLKDLDITSTIRQIIKSTIRVDDVSKKIDALERERDEIELTLSNLIDTKVKTPDLPDSIFNTKYQEYTHRLKELTNEINKLELEHVRIYDTRQRLDRIDEILKQKQNMITELDSEVLRTFIYRMISVSPTEMVYCIAGTKNYTDDEFSLMRKDILKQKPLCTGIYRSEKYDKEMYYRVVVI